jgi:hypothetical protein
MKLKKLIIGKKISEMTIEELNRETKNNTFNHYFLCAITFLILVIGCYAYNRLDKFNVQFISLCFGMTGFVWATSIYDYVLNLEIEIEKLRREIKK